MADPEQNNQFRRGPSPLPVHLGLAMAEYAKAQQSGCVSQSDLNQMMAGIRKYQDHPYHRSVDPLPIVWRDGEVKVFFCAAKKTVASILLVPSLINKSSILDLLPERSFLRWLAGQGIDAYLLDWGKPVQDEMLHNIDDLVAHKLCAAIEQIAAQNRVPGKEKIHALGYCMGGTLLAAAAMVQPDFLCSIICLASPWDFHAGDQDLSDQVRMGTASALQAIADQNLLPTDWIQSVFAAVNADRAQQKFSDFSALDNDSEKARLFVAVEDWLNDGVDLPGGLAQTCVVDWYCRNLPGQGRWNVAGQTMDLSRLTLPALIVASTNDRLVSQESSLAMAGLMPHADTMEPSSGHIGMMTGSKARAQVWEPLAAWVKDHA
ncbi:MAG: alpha/beta fold hydrolase [Rhodospirillales bacterium]|nr:alpha/beta fold hydrolase [Rhodospirillales bacterium]MCB9995467.1 alpha/beta fold hydrolase [Rhodospirillales bacterium]